jgi:general secretion pathway protein I
MHTYTKHLTVGTLLARSKITDLEQQLYDDGFAADDQELDGDFSEEGWGSYTWKAEIKVPHTQDLSPDALVSALFGIPLGEGGLDAMLFGGGADGASGSGDEKGGGGPIQGASPMAGAMAGIAQTQMQQMLTQIQDAVREIHLTVSWKDGKVTQSIDLTTDVVSLGPGSDRNGFLPGTNGQVAPSTANASGTPQQPVNGNTIQNGRQNGGPFVNLPGGLSR